MRKYQEGGQLSDTQQQGLQYLAQMYAQQTGKDPQQDQEGFMQFVQQLAQQAGVQDIGQLLDMVYQQASQQAQSARRGAKLNYLKSLMGKCPEGQELVYFKAGGKVCSKCMAKKQDGDTIEEAKCGKKMSKKKACGGIKINKEKLVRAKCGSKIEKGQKGLKKMLNTATRWLDAGLNPYRPETSDWYLDLTVNHGDGRTDEWWKNEETDEYKIIPSVRTFGGALRNLFGKKYPEPLKPSRKVIGLNPTRSGGVSRDSQGVTYGRPYSLREAQGFKKNGGSLNRIPFNRKGQIMEDESNKPTEIIEPAEIIERKTPYGFWEDELGEYHPLTPEQLREHEEFERQRENFKRWMIAKHAGALTNIHNPVNYAGNVERSPKFNEPILVVPLNKILRPFSK